MGKDEEVRDVVLDNVPKQVAAFNACRLCPG
jgi:hypothetical protein